MEDNKFHIPARRKEKNPAKDRCNVRITPEAYNILVDMYNESTVSMAQIASTAIIYASKNAVYDKEEV
ncbi:MAG: hypothetical protein ACERKZ_05825 [Lachnotalea sp.]